MTTPNVPLADRVFKQENSEFYVGCTPSWVPVSIARQDTFATSPADFIVLGIIRACIMLLLKVTHPRYVVTVSVRDVSRRPYVWRIVKRSEAKSHDQARSLQAQIVDDWAKEDYASLPRLRRTEESNA